MLVPAASAVFCVKCNEHYSQEKSDAQRPYVRDGFRSLCRVFWTHDLPLLVLLIQQGPEVPEWKILFQVAVEHPLDNKQVHTWKTEQRASLKTETEQMLI